MPDSAVLTFDAATFHRSDAGRRPDAGLDAAAPPDARVGTDSGPPVDAMVGVDSGVVGGDCILRVPVGAFGPLGRACLPRCSAGTAASYRACSSQSCRNAAVDADTTPGIEYYIGSVVVTTPLDCVACIAYQEFHCFSLVCIDEVDDYVDECIVGSDTVRCDNAILAVDYCLAGLSPSQNATVGACMDSEDGVEGCFP